MLVLSCNPSDYDVSTGVCSAPFYSEISVSFLSGWALADVRALFAGVLAFLAVAYIFRVLHRELSQF